MWAKSHKTTSTKNWDADVIRRFNTVYSFKTFFLPYLELAASMIESARVFTFFSYLLFLLSLFPRNLFMIMTRCNRPIFKFTDILLRIVWPLSQKRAWDFELFNTVGRKKSTLIKISFIRTYCTIAKIFQSKCHGFIYIDYGVDQDNNIPSFMPNIVLNLISWKFWLQSYISYQKNYPAIPLIFFLLSSSS